MNTTVYITSPGDRSVGISPSTTTVSFDTDMVRYGSDRKDLRAALKKFFIDHDLHGDSRIGVRFMDECDYCGSKMLYDKLENPNWMCANPDCILNRPQEEA